MFFTKRKCKNKDYSIDYHRMAGKRDENMTNDIKKKYRMKFGYILPYEKVLM